MPTVRPSAAGAEPPMEMLAAGEAFYMHKRERTLVEQTVTTLNTGLSGFGDEKVKNFLVFFPFFYIKQPSLGKSWLFLAHF